MLAPLMGTTAHLVVVGPPGATAELEDRAYRRLVGLEARWTRFRDSSEIARLNAAAGRPVVVSLDTFRVVERAIQGWRMTGGRYDPTVHDAVVAAGYDRSFDEMDETRMDEMAAAPWERDGRDAARATRGAAVPPVPGCGEIALLSALPGVLAPDGVRIDLGGVAKGFAADLVTTELLASGADGACVNIGGDLRAEGRAPTEDGWIVAVEDPGDPERELCRVAISAGAVATSTSAKRRWKTPAGEAHHLIDPATGRPAATDARSVTVVAGEAWLAEVLAKAAFVAGVDEGLRLLELAGVAGLAVSLDGETVATSGMEDFWAAVPHLARGGAA